MSKTKTTFDTVLPHIHTEFFVINHEGVQHSFDGVVDTGAPRTEFNDLFLVHAGFIKHTDFEVPIKPGLQTQKYGKIVLPSIEICGLTIKNLEVLVSRFEKSWGTAALIGLDFFRRFDVLISYNQGCLIAEKVV